MKKSTGVLLVLSVLVLTACAAGPNSLVGVASEAGTKSGFLMGLWQGLISPLTFIVSLFTDDVSIYEVHNNGGWYDFGFILGIGAFGSGCAKCT